MSKYNYIREKLSMAIFECFATGKGDARSRLLDGCKYHLSRLAITPEPDEFTKDFKHIWQRLNRKDPIIDVDGNVL